MRLAILGLSHKTASIELRERFANVTANLDVVLTELRRVETVEEVCIISTCNRVEFYVSGNAEDAHLARALRSYLQRLSGIALAELDPHLYGHEGEAALHHLFRVASSLDSMVLGEPQILGQVKEAYHWAENAGSLGPNLMRVFPKAFGVAKRVRTETGIAENAVSMSFAAVELGRQIFDTFEGKEILLIGAGKMAGLAAKHLLSSGAKAVRVASRSLGTAQKLAEQIGGTASSLADLPILLSQADIVISSTAAPGFVVDKKMMQKVVRGRRYRPILFVDIAVPRDIDPRVGELDNVYVYDVDDLEAVLASNREGRAKEAAAAEKLIQEELATFLRWSKSQQVVPVIKALRERALSIAQAEVERTLANVKDADPKVHQSVKAMSNAIVNKLLHPVLTRLKTEGAGGDPQPLIDALAKLFEIDPKLFEEPPKEESPKTPGVPEDNVVPFRGKDQAGGDP